MPKLPPLGAHVSVAGGMPTAIERASELGCTAIQVFVKNANQWQGRDLGKEEIAALRAAHGASAVGPLLAHASYLINLCATDPALLARSRQALARERARFAPVGGRGRRRLPGSAGPLGAGAGRRARALRPVGGRRARRPSRRAPRRGRGGGDGARRCVARRPPRRSAALARP